jgi:hypothetical protein
MSTACARRGPRAGSRVLTQLPGGEECRRAQDSRILFLTQPHLCSLAAASHSRILLLHLASCLLDLMTLLHLILLLILLRLAVYTWPCLWSLLLQSPAQDSTLSSEAH